jgi:hypothetical protein
MARCDRHEWDTEDKEWCYKCDELKYKKDMEEQEIIDDNNLIVTTNETPSIRVHGEESTNMTLTLSNKKNSFNETEFVFQFNDGDPVLFAATQNNKLQFTVDNSSHGILTFFDKKGNKFKIFAREKK